MTTSPKLGVPYLASMQGTPEITHNEAIALLAGILHGVIDKGVNTPAVGPADGDSYIVGTAPTGAWAGRENCIAVFVTNAWRFLPGDDSAGTPIAMGTAQEGLRVWVNDENLFYVWAGGVWSTSTGAAAVDISFSPTGGIAATNVQTMGAELDSEKVAKAGDTMTGPLVINAGSALTPATAGFTTRSDDAGAIGPVFAAWHNSASPAIGDNIAIFGRSYFNNLSAAQTVGGQMVFATIDLTLGAESLIWALSTRQAGVTTARVNVGAGLYMAGATGADPGGGNINAINYFDDGVNINTIYAALSGGAAFIGGSYSFTGGTFTYSRNDANPIAAVVGDGFLAVIDAASYLSSVSGSLVRVRKFRGTLAAPLAVIQNDVCGSYNFNAYDGAAERAVCIQTVRVVAAVPSGTDMQGNYILGLNSAGTVSPSNIIEANHTNGVNVSPLAVGLLVSGFLVADINGLLRCRVLTVGTLPAAAGRGGARAQVNDALAPAFNAVVAAGGAITVPVNSDGANWVCG